MNEVCEFLMNCGTFYLATEENGQPHVRPFGAVCAFEGKLYIVTNNQKKAYQQMIKNGKVEICGMHNGKWIRVEGTVKEDLRREARAAMMEANTAALSSMYTVDDHLMTVPDKPHALAYVRNDGKPAKTPVFPRLWKCGMIGLKLVMEAGKCTFN